MSGISRPAVLPFGVTFGKFNSSSLSDYTPTGDLSDSLYREHQITSLEEFNKFERQVNDFIMARLGYPNVRVELSPFQVKTCIDEAIAQLDYHAPYWTTQFATFATEPNVNVYEIPLYIMNNLIYVNYKKNLLTIQSDAGSIEQDYFIKFFQGANLFSDFSVGEFYLLQMHLKMVRKVLSQEGHFEVIDGKYLLLTPTPVSNLQDVILIYRGLNSETIQPYYKNWMSRYALATAKGILGEVRGKFKTLPGPGGGAQLNGEELKAESVEEKKLLKEELIAEIEEPPIMSIY